MTSLRLPARAGMLALTTLWLLAACDGGGDGDGGVDGGAMDTGVIDAFVPRRDGDLPRCERDEECDDGVACTRDSCGMNGLCRNQVDIASCDDGIFCNGVEQCDTELGCVPGRRQTCNDDDVCTIDRCSEEEKLCEHFPRDLDEDGDPDWFCSGGGDCDDTNSLVSSLINEVCDDGIDNDCDEMVDESECGRPRYDECSDPLDVSAGGFFELNTDGASPDYTLGCRSTTRDLVATFTLAEARSVTIEAEGDFFTVAASLRTTCEDRTTEIACESGFPGLIRRRSLDAGTYFIVVAASSTGTIGLDVEFGPPIPPSANQTCATAIDVSAGGRFNGSFVEVSDDVMMTGCGFTGSPDLVYTFTTTAEQDVTISAQATTGESVSYAVRSACDMASTQVRCDYGNPAAGVLHQLPAGTYFIIVEGPTFRAVDFTLDVAYGPPTPPAPGDTCTNAIALVEGVAVMDTFLDKQNDVDVSCGFRNRDAVYTFELTETRDVLVELDAGSFANASIRTSCDDAMTELRCTSGNPLRQRIRNLGAGTYYVIAESSRAGTFELTYSSSAPTIPTAVSGNDNCASAHVIPATGGLFSGSTATLLPDLGARCGSGATSNDAAFVLTLTSRSRVVASTDGSSFDTVLHLHGATCTDRGELFCDDDGGEGATSLIDQTLDPGTYHIVVDGFSSGSAGNYLLEVMVTAP